LLVLQTSFPPMPTVERPQGQLSYYFSLIPPQSNIGIVNFLLPYTFTFFFLIVGRHDGICKSSYKMSTISYLNSPSPPFSFIPSTFYFWRAVFTHPHLTVTCASIHFHILLRTTLQVIETSFALLEKIWRLSWKYPRSFTIFIDYIQVAILHLLSKTD
jgi:hypothetical protein